MQLETSKALDYNFFPRLKIDRLQYNIVCMTKGFVYQKQVYTLHS